jgi:hypothetical protein
MERCLLHLSPNRSDRAALARFGRWNDRHCLACAFTQTHSWRGSIKNGPLAAISRKAPLSVVFRTDAHTPGASTRHDLTVRHDPSPRGACSGRRSCWSVTRGNDGGRSTLMIEGSLGFGHSASSGTGAWVGGTVWDGDAHAVAARRPEWVRGLGSRWYCSVVQLSAIPAAWICYRTRRATPGLFGAIATWPICEDAFKCGKRSGCMGSRSALLGLHPANASLVRSASRGVAACRGGARGMRPRAPLQRTAIPSLSHPPNGKTKLRGRFARWSLASAAPSSVSATIVGPRVWRRVARERRAIVPLIAAWPKNAYPGTAWTP